VSGARERRRQVGEAWTTWLVTRGQWRSVAACRSADPDLFFPISDSGPALEQAAKAKAICAGCRVRPECLAFALRTGQVHGIWGGTTEHERTAVRLRALSEQPVTEKPCLGGASRGG
jgi:WhiB family transcriptional regulator, redox-sensing transcriptional regulator